MKKYLLIWLIMLFLLLEPAAALTKYGIARISAGELIVVREEQESIYVPEDGEVEILLNDVLRVGQNSFVILSTVDQTDVKMGSNAVFQIKPWKSRNKTGYLRMLYGKMNFKTKKLEKRRRFRFKTASATIGVRGTGADCEVGSSGNTGCTGRSGKTEIQGNYGPSRELTTNRMSIVVGNRPASQMIEMAPKESGTDEKQEEKALAKASPTSSQSTSLSQEQEALGTGVIEPEHLEESKKEEVNADESLKQEMIFESEKEGDEEVETDEDFEKDLEESEEDAEVVELEISAPLDIPGQIDVETDVDATPELPEINVEDDIEDAVQESKNASGRLNLDFDK